MDLEKYVVKIMCTILATRFRSFRGDCNRLEVVPLLFIVQIEFPSVIETSDVIGTYLVLSVIARICLGEPNHCLPIKVEFGGSVSGRSPKWMIYDEKSYQMDD